MRKLERRKIMENLVLRWVHDEALYNKRHVSQIQSAKSPKIADRSVLAEKFVLWICRHFFINFVQKFRFVRRIYKA